MSSRRRVFTLSLVMLVAGFSQLAFAQFNYDEKKVPKFNLPDPLVTSSGKKITTVDAWQKIRRPEVLELFEKHVYGRAPGKPDGLKFELREVNNKVLDGRATRKQVRVFFKPGHEEDAWMDLLIYIPNDRKAAAGGFVGLNFNGNHSVTEDTVVPISPRWIRRNQPGVKNHRASEASRGSNKSRWAISEIIDRGFMLATAYCGDIDPDYHDEFKNGVHPLFYKKGQTKPAADEWGTISAWAWGLSRIMDYFETDEDIDQKKIAVIGHSRLGKTSLWAGASDERFAIVISNNSGCGGAALSRRAFGETVKRINTSFPHWFCDNYLKFNDNEDACPVDQHMLIALMAPRPTYVASAVEDRWADPRGEFLSAKYAEPVYALFGLKGLNAKKWPDVDKPVSGTLGYHIRTGKHDVTDYDWKRYMDFAEKHWGKAK